MTVKKSTIKFLILIPLMAVFSSGVCSCRHMETQKTGASELTVEEAESFPEEKSGKVFFSTSFEPSENKAFTLRDEARIVNAGINGTMALEISRRSADTYSISGISLGKMPPGNYELSVMMRASDICDSNGSKSQRVQAVSMEHWRGEKYIAGQSSFLILPKDGSWKQLTFPISPPADADRSSLAFYLRKGMTGTVWLDDLRITSKAEGVLPAVNLLKPERLTVFGNNAEIVFKGSRGCCEGMNALIRLGDARQVVRCGPDLIFRADFRNLLPGTLPLEIRILDPVKKKCILRNEFKIFVRNSEPEPAAAVRFDSSQNLIVDEKPFMVIGIFGPAREARKFKEAGFNTVMDYTLFGDKGEQKNRIAAIRARLDLIKQHDLKAIVSVQHQYPGRPSATTGFDNVSGVYECVSAAADGIKDHPALLAWYVSDEMPRDGLPYVHKIRQHVSHADPWHPTCTLTCRPEDMPEYANTGDVISMDPYPVRSAPGSYSILPIAEQTDLAVSTGLPVWMTCQAFSWGVYDCTDAAKYPASRKLGADEMLAMPLLAAVHGAKGFLFFSYDGAWIRPQKLNPGEESENWTNLKRCTAVLQNLAPFIMGPRSFSVKFEENQDGELHGRVFEDGKGNIRVILVGVQNKAVSRFHLPEYPVLKSRNGLTRHLGNKRYEINVTGVQSDILFSEQE